MHAQTVHLTPNHPHLRHIGHPPSSLICTQSPHQQQHQQIITNSSQNSVQNHCTSTSKQQPHQSQLSEDNLHEMQMIHQNASHFHQSQNGESRPSVIESNQPMIIECT